MTEHYALRDVMVTPTPVGTLVSHHLRYRHHSAAEAKSLLDRLADTYRDAGWTQYVRDEFSAAYSDGALFVLMAVVDLALNDLNPLLCPN